MPTPRVTFRPVLTGLTLLVCALGACTAARNQPALDLERVAWQHGAADCASQTDPAIQVVRYDAQTWILRQNKCLNY